MKFYLILTTLFCIGGFYNDSSAQTTLKSETIDQIELAAFAGKSYIVNSYGKLLPGFSINASTNGSFYLRANPNPNVVSNSSNFVRTETFLIPTTDPASLSNLSVNEKSTVYEYFDGLGRSSQNIHVKGSPSQNDIVGFNTYDENGNQPKEYLSYAVASGNGAIRNDAVKEQTSFYLTPPAGVVSDTEPFKINIFNTTPANDLKEVYKAGADWHEGGGNKSVKSTTRFNTLNEISGFSYDGSALPANGGYFPANTLSVKESIDEAAQITRTYTDFRGQVLITRVGDGTTWHDTYNAYDYAGNLRYVFPPEAMAHIADYYALSAVDKQLFLDRLGFQYQYDGEQRMIAKRGPGSVEGTTGWTVMVYDQWNRIVLTQDPAQRTRNEYAFTKYDRNNRTILTGLYTTTTALATLRTNASTSTVRFETETTDATGYTLTSSFPTGISETNLLTVNYYDYYSFITNTGWDVEANVYTFVNITGYPQSSNSMTTAKGYPTGSKIRVIGQSRWLNAVTYYDRKYHVIQVIKESPISGITRSTNNFLFSGRLDKNQFYNSLSALTTQNDYTYDPAGRVLTVKHSINGAGPILMASNSYNELGQLKEKNIHSTDNGATFLQSIDNLYNIQGWKTKINNSALTPESGDTNADLFGMEILYNQEQLTVNGTSSKKLYNGNISAIRWSKNNLKNTPKENVYSYNYDPWNRLYTSNYASKVAGAWTGDANAFDENLTYDNNGNIATLKRNGIIGGNIVSLDDLTYRYELKTSLGDAANVAYSNKLLNVYDNSTRFANDNPDNGFMESSRTKTITEYSYDQNGNVTFDANKNITLIQYNHLNLPIYIEFYSASPSTKQTIEYTYDATGTKLKQITKVGGAVITTTDYVGDNQYENGQLAFILHNEGRIVNKNGTYDYEYFLKDHQGNTRVVYGYQKEINEYKATLELERDDTEKNKDGFKNIARSTGYNYTNKTYETPTPIYAAKLSGAVGPAKILTVKQGDKVSLETYARYTGVVKATKITPAVLAATVTSAFQLLPSGETLTAFNGVNSGVMAATVTPNEGAPVAYLFYFIFSPDYTWSQFGVYPITTAAALGFEWLHLDVPITLPTGIAEGYMYTYVANQTTGTFVYFDDFHIVHEKANAAVQVTQASDYYPFGLTNAALSYQKQIPSKNKYLFQGQEQQNDFGVNWYQYKFRMHDPSIGRFGSVDPLAEKYNYNSVYAFSENRVVDGVELEGSEFLSADAIALGVVYGQYVDNNSGRWDNGWLSGGWNMISDAAYNHAVSYTNYFTGGFSYGQESYNYNNSKGAYSDQVGMSDESKQFLNLTNQANNAAQIGKGFNTMLGDATSAMTFVMGLESTGISMLKEGLYAPRIGLPEGSIFSFGNDPATLTNTIRSPRLPTDIVIVHGSYEGFIINGNFTSAQDLATMMYARGYKSGTAVTLVSCFSGVQENGAAYQLSGYLNAPVRAPTNFIGTFENGSYFIEGNGNWNYFNYK